MSGSPGRQCPAATQPVHDVAQLARRSPRWRRRPGRAGPRPAPRSRSCARAPARPRTSTASPGSSARCPWPGRRRGRTAGPGWSAASGRSHGLTSTASTIRVRRPAAAAARPRRGAAARPRSGPWLSPSYMAPCPRRCSGGQRQIDQRPHRPVRAQQRVGQLEQRIRPRGQAGVELVAEPAQPGDRLDSGTVVVHAVHRGLRSIMVSLGENTIFRRPPHVAATRRHAARPGRSPTPQVKRQAKRVTTAPGTAGCPGTAQDRWPAAEHHEPQVGHGREVPGGQGVAGSNPVVPTRRTRAVLDL